MPWFGVKTVYSSGGCWAIARRAVLSQHSSVSWIMNLDFHACASPRSADLGVVAKACSRHPSYLNDLYFGVLDRKLQCWERVGICVLLPGVGRGCHLLSGYRELSSNISQHRTHLKVLLKLLL